MKEVELAMKQMGPMKTPDLDSFHPLLFQQHWDLIGKKVADAVLKVVNEGLLQDVKALFQEVGGDSCHFIPDKKTKAHELASRAFYFKFLFYGQIVSLKSNYVALAFELKVFTLARGRATFIEEVEKVLAEITFPRAVATVGDILRWGMI
ncbi:Uncharacterized protein Fot_36966 [Forsythia ovata]|uniref:Uncharacterized protein n=1 Tax=Forsythia ovata TaxID=205694 RepID=A0ABD1SQY2_9LAMI